MPSANGGVARYIDAIAKTIPNVEVVDYASARVRKLDEYDAIWIHHVLPVGTWGWLRRLRGGKPYVIFLHGLDFDLARRSAWKRWLTRRILRSAQDVVTNSNALAQEVATFAQIALPMVVYPCVSDELVAASKIPSATQHQSSQLRILTVGRLVERKGHMKVLEAIKDDAHFDYTIVGDGPMRAAISARIRELGITDRIHMCTNVDNVGLADIYRNADVFVMPSTKSAEDREGFGIVYIEAALFGLPSIAVGQPGVDEAIIDGVTGVLIDDSIDALKKATGYFLTDRSNCIRLGLAGRARVLAEFTREAQFSRLRSIL